MKYLSISIIVCLVCTLAACSGDSGPSTVTISDTLCLRKMALDLTDKGPSQADITAIEDTSKTLETIADEYMATPEFEQVIFNWYRELFPPRGISPPGIDYEEPSRIAREVVIGDRDFKEILTADYTVLPDGTITPVTGKPVAGVLSTQHYMSSHVGSLRRNWAGYYVKTWGGFRLEPISLPPGVDDAELTRDAITSNPSCASCHANELYGIDFVGPIAECFTAQGLYDANCQEQGGKYLAQDISNLTQLGQVTADSKEFMSFTINFFYEKLFGRPLARQELEIYDGAAQALLSGNGRIKELLKHIVTSPEYCSR